MMKALVTNTSKRLSKNLVPELAKQTRRLSVEPIPPIEKKRKLEIKPEPKTKRARVEIEYEAPAHWKEVYDHIQDMRTQQIAPVDTMGCATFKDPDYTPAEARYHILVSLMLSAQTKDAVTADAMRSLKTHGLTIPNILATPTDELDKLICKVGFHQRKAGYIKKSSQILHEKYADDVPAELDQLLELPGVGPKMAFLFLTHGWDKPIGIGVDVHVHRIANRLGWVDTNTPEKTRVALEGWLPKEYWGKAGVNKLLVGFGQTICTPVSPKCAQCKVNDLCPSAFKVTKKKAAEKKKEKEGKKDKKKKDEKKAKKEKEEKPSRKRKQEGENPPKRSPKTKKTKTK